jgi:hypothetical protein
MFTKGAANLPAKTKAKKKQEYADRSSANGKNSVKRQTVSEKGGAEAGSQIDAFTRRIAATGRPIRPENSKTKDSPQSFGGNCNQQTTPQARTENSSCNHYRNIRTGKAPARPQAKSGRLDGDPSACKTEPGSVRGAAKDLIHRGNRRRTRNGG